MHPGHLGMVLGKSKLKHSLDLQEHHGIMGNENLYKKSQGLPIARSRESSGSRQR